MKKVRCKNSNECNVTYCSHFVEHEHNSTCESYECGYVNKKVKCKPVIKKKSLGKRLVELIKKNKNWEIQKIPVESVVTQRKHAELRMRLDIEDYDKIKNILMKISKKWRKK